MEEAAKAATGQSAPPPLPNGPSSSGSARPPQKTLLYSSCSWQVPAFRPVIPWPSVLEPSTSRVPGVPMHAESDQVPAFNRQLLYWEHTYNCVRQHQSLAYLTPFEFITRWKSNPRKAKCHQSTRRVHMISFLTSLC